MRVATLGDILTLYLLFGERESERDNPYKYSFIQLL